MWFILPPYTPPKLSEFSDPHPGLRDWSPKPEGSWGIICMDMYTYIHVVSRYLYMHTYIYIYKYSYMYIYTCRLYCLKKSFDG